MLFCGYLTLGGQFTPEWYGQLHRNIHGSPATSTDQNPTGITFNSAGTKQVTLTVNQDGGCTTTAIQSINVENIYAQNGKLVKVCHLGKTITVGQNALAPHLAHGDCIGSCGFSAKTENDFSETAVEERTLNFSIHPNPANEKATVSFSFPYDDYTKIVLYNYLGEKVREIFKGNVKANANYSFDIDLKTISDGIYFGSLQTSSERRIIKLIKLK